MYGCEDCGERIPNDCKNICPSCRRFRAEVAEERDREWWAE